MKAKMQNYLKMQSNTAYVETYLVVSHTMRVGKNIKIKTKKERGKYYE